MFSLDPLTDPRWDELVGRHPCASVFHTRGWLEALKLTYGFEPIVLTTTGGGELKNGLALCQIPRRWGAPRLVSLPFTDHCDPLFDDDQEFSELVAGVVSDVGKGRWRSVELRPRSVPAPVGQGVPDSPTDARVGRSLDEAGGLAAIFWLHTLDLRPNADEIFARFHPSSTRRAIRRAEREGLTCEAGTSEELLAAFYDLLRLTRRRHGLPPQPLAWFRTLVRCLGDAVTVHLASIGGRPIAGIVTLQFGKQMVYKYGGSDARDHRLGAMPFLFWRVIEDARRRGFEELDLGRSDLDQPGLIAFKDHLGASRTMLTYYAFPEPAGAALRDGRMAGAARRVLAHLPDWALDLTGRAVYKHLG